MLTRKAESLLASTEVEHHVICENLIEHRRACFRERSTGAIEPRRLPWLAEDGVALVRIGGGDDAAQRQVQRGRDLPGCNGTR